MEGLKERPFVTAPGFVWLGLGPQRLKSEKDLYFEALVFQLKLPICEVNLPIRRITANRGDGESFVISDSRPGNFYSVREM